MHILGLHRPHISSNSFCRPVSYTRKSIQGHVQSTVRREPERVLRRFEHHPRTSEFERDRHLVRPRSRVENVRVRRVVLLSVFRTGDAYVSLQMQSCRPTLRRREGLCQFYDSHTSPLFQKEAPLEKPETVPESLFRGRELVRKLVRGGVVTSFSLFPPLPKKIKTTTRKSMPVKRSLRYKKRRSKRSRQKHSRASRRLYRAATEEETFQEELKVIITQLSKLTLEESNNVPTNWKNLVSIAYEYAIAVDNKTVSVDLSKRFSEAAEEFMKSVLQGEHRNSRNAMTDFDRKLNGLIRQLYMYDRGLRTACICTTDSVVRALSFPNSTTQGE